MSRSLLTIDGLSIGYSTPHGENAAVVRDVSLELARGASLGLVGESGCGKSTLALALLGFLRHGSRRFSGTVQLDGIDLFELPPARLRSMRGGRVALVPQNAGQSLTPTMRVGTQIMEALRLHSGLEPRQARRGAVELLGQVRLPDPEQISRRYPHQLSGGQQQRVAIAMALAGEPELLVLDEPTTGLDVTTQAHILDLLEEIRTRNGAAMVYVSHDLGVIARVSERLAVMYAGEIVESGAVETIFSRPHHPYTRGLLASVPRLDLPLIPRAMPGQPPAPGRHSQGCAFAPRCPLADERCRNEAPRLETVNEQTGDYQVRCHHWRQADTLATPPRITERRRNGASEPLVALHEVAISYARPGAGSLLRRLRNRPAPPPTVAAISLEIHKGETLALVGESGSGKSTLARAIAGLQTTMDGELRLGELDLRLPVERRPADLRRTIQLIFQNPDASLNGRQTVGEIIERPLQIFFGLPRAERRARAQELLEQMRLGAHYLERFPAQLSGGEKQRVAIARAFAAEPQLILCDEVVSALDVSVQAAVLDLLGSLQADRGVTYLFISHDLAVVRAIADRVAVLYQGRLCEIGRVEQVYAPPFHPYTQALLAAAPEPVPGRRSRALTFDVAVSGAPARGCPFQQRCPRHIGPICDQETPPWRTAADGHLIRCHRPLEELVLETVLEPRTREPIV